MLGWQFKGDSFTARFTYNDFLLVNNVGVINKSSNIEANIFNDVFANNLGNDNILDDTSADRFRIGQVNSNIKWDSHQGNPICLRLIFLATILVFTSSIAI